MADHYSKTSVLSLSTEIYIQIFSYLDPVHSTCLGLIARRLYKVHFALRRKVPLDSCTYECPIPSTNLCTLCFLHTHLQDWRPRNLTYCGGCHKFCRTSNWNGKHIDLLRARCDSCAPLSLFMDIPGGSSLSAGRLPEVRRLQGLGPVEGLRMEARTHGGSHSFIFYQTAQPDQIPPVLDLLNPWY